MATADKPFLTVYTFDSNHKEYSYSAFCTKLHFRLRYAGIPYADGKGTRNQAPKSKIPYVRFEETGEFMGDSGLVTQKLIDQGKLEDLNVGLGPEERAKDFCLRAMIEDRMYYYTVYERWFENRKTMRDQGPFGNIPWGIRHLAGVAIYGYCWTMLYFQGTGRHNSDEVKLLRREAVGAVADYAEAALAKMAGKDDKEPFWILGGEKPTEADFTLFGYLSGHLVTPPNPFLTGLIKENKALVTYVERIHNKYFADFKSPF